MPDLSSAVIARLQRRHAAGTSLTALATELGIAKATLRKRLLALPATSGGLEPPKTKPPSSARMPHRLRSLPPRPAEPERSKNALRAELAEALARTARL
jgi:hypothetical protein